MLKHKTFTVIITVLLSVLLFTCIVFAACGEEPTPTPEPEPTPPTEHVSDVERKVFQFTPEYSGEYIFFGNIYFGELEVITNEGDDLTPDADGEYRLTAGTPYTIAIEEPKFRELKLEYDISDDREVTLAPGEERIVKLGKIYDEVKTITTGNDSISIAGIYTGAADDLDGYRNGLVTATSSRTLPWDSGKYFVVIKNDTDVEQTSDISFRQVKGIQADSDGNAQTVVKCDADNYVCVAFDNVPKGYYVFETSENISPPTIYSSEMERVPYVYTGTECYFNFGDGLDIYLFIQASSYASINEIECMLRKYGKEYFWEVNGEPSYTHEVYLKQGESVSISFTANGSTPPSCELYDVDRKNEYSYTFDGEVLTLGDDCYVDGGFFSISASFVSEGFNMVPDLDIIPTLAKPFAGVTFETSNDRTLMTWENVPNLYSFTYSVNGGEEREVIVSDVTFLDITSYLPENARRALVEITDITYSYPVYDDNGEPTEETRKVVHDDVMKFVAEL